jgi:glycosyltransferase involved in cell wall biosynthesis
MLSVILNAKNEENVIKGCLESIKWADEIIVVLNDSTDKTDEVARKYTDKIIKISGQDFAKVKNKGLEEAKGDWVLFIDADERVLLPLRQEIESIMESSENSAYALSRINVIFGFEERYGPFWPDWIIRLVKKDDVKEWVGKVHEHLEFNGNLGYSKNSLLHLTHRNIDHFILKALEWSKIDAQLRLDSGHPKMTKWRFVRIFLSELYTQGIKRRGFLAGTVGMIDSMLQVFFFYMTYTRLWELQQPKPIEQVYEDLDKKLIENNFKYEKD